MFSSLKINLYVGRKNEKIYIKTEKGNFLCPEGLVVAKICQFQLFVSLAILGDKYISTKNNQRNEQ